MSEETPTVPNKRTKLDDPAEHLVSNVRTLEGIPNPEGSGVAIRIPSATDDGPSSDVDLTYRDVRDLIAETSKSICRRTGLGSNGVSGDDCLVVSVVCDNTMPFVLSFLGVGWTGGATVAPLNPKYTASEYEFYMQDAKSTLLLVPEAGGNGPAEEAATKLGLPIYSVGWDASKPRESTVTHKSGPETIKGLEAKGDDFEPDVPKVDDVAMFMHTSGTTSRPKGVPLMHQNLAASVTNISKHYKLGESDAVLLVMPLFHVHGLMSALLSTLATGGTVIMPPEGKFSASHFWRYAHRGATWVTAVPTMWQVLLLRYEADYPKDDPPKFRFVRSCSSSLAPVTLKEIESKFGARCLEAYAMTEASHQMCSNPLPEDGPAKAGTVGKGTGVEIAILDKDNRVVETPGTQGEVCIKGPNVTKGYRNAAPEVNVEAFAGGWFHTGDQGFLDAEGYLTLTGRIKELINRGGEKISPLEVDATILAHPRVAEAVSFAAPDEVLGEVVAAAVVLKDDAKGEGLTLEELKEFLKDRLSSFKVPTKLFVDDTLPKTATGKIQRRIVAAHFLEKK